MRSIIIYAAGLVGLVILAILNGIIRTKLFQDYNFIKGRVWSLVLIWMAVTPYLFYRIRS